MDEWEGLEDPYQCKELYHEFKSRLLGSNVSSKYENDWKSVILYPNSNKTVTSLPRRLKEQRREYSKFLQTEEEFTNKIIDTYTQCNNPKKDIDPWEEFSRLDSLTSEFLSFVKKDDQKSSLSSKKWRKSETSIDNLMNAIAVGDKLREKSLSHNIPPSMLKDNPDLPALISLLPINPKPRCPSPPKSEGEGEGEDDEEDSESISDYFAGVRHEPKPVLKCAPPQNQILPKTFTAARKKYGSVSFKTKEKKQEADPDYKFFEIV